MPARITVYCTRHLTHLTVSKLLQWLDQADLWTLAEGYGIEDEEVVNMALKHLRLESSHQDGISSFQLSYRPEGLRPIIIEWIAMGADVGKLVQEELEELTDASEPGAERVRAHLVRVQEAVDIEYGFPSPNDMGEVMAYELARWIATNGEGYVKDDDQAWWTLDDWLWQRIYPEQG